MIETNNKLLLFLPKWTLSRNSSLFFLITIEFFSFIKSIPMNDSTTLRPNKLDPHQLDPVHIRPRHVRPIQVRPSKLDPIFSDYDFFSKPVYTKLKAFPSLVIFIFFLACPISFSWQMSDLSC